MTTKQLTDLAASLQGLPISVPGPYGPVADPEARLLVDYGKGRLWLDSPLLDRERRELQENVEVNAASAESSEGRYDHLKELVKEFLEAEDGEKADALEKLREAV